MIDMPALRGFVRFGVKDDASMGAF